MYPILPLLVLLICFEVKQFKPEEDKSSAFTERLKRHSTELKKFAVSQKASTQVGLLVDMSLPSWKKRLFLVDLESGSILVSGLCSHGVCDNLNSEEVKFSNTPGSSCTSGGRYRIGDKFRGEYGLGYKLHGLDSSNSNAYKRNIVLHYYPSVSNKEGKPATRSNGCPMVSAEVFTAIAKSIDASDKPVLLWIYK